MTSMTMTGPMAPRRKVGTGPGVLRGGGHILNPGPGWLCVLALALGGQWLWAWS